MNTVNFFIIIWLLFRLLNVFTFVAFDLGIYHVNEYVQVKVWNPLLNVTELVRKEKEDVYMCRDHSITSPATQKGVIVYILVASSLQLLFDLGDAVHKTYTYRKGWHKWTEKGKKKFAVQILFYRIMQFLAEFAMCVGALSMLTPIIHSVLVSDLIYIQVSFGVTWPLMYFLQLAPWIGKMVVTVQRMINDLYKYCLLYSIFLVTLAHSFLRLVSQGNNKTGNCSQDFATVPDTWYR